jgi:hypothetical protein
MRSEHGDRRWRDTWDSECVSKRIRPNLGEPLNDFSRKPGDAIEAEVGGDSSPLVMACSSDFTFLPPKIPLELHGRLEATHVHARARVVEADRQTVRHQ